MQLRTQHTHRASCIGQSATAALAASSLGKDHPRTHRDHDISARSNGNGEDMHQAAHHDRRDDSTTIDRLAHDAIDLGGRIFGALRQFGFVDSVKAGNKPALALGRC